MTFAVLMRPKAAEELDKIKELRINPERVGKRLRYTAFWSTRIGYYHAIYEIKMDRGQMVVLYVGHRRNVYDDFSRIF